MRIFHSHHLGVLLSLRLMCSAACASLLIFTLVQSVFAAEEMFKIRGRSMEPTLLSGDRILVDDSSFDHLEPKQGDIVTISLKSRQTLMIKRVAAVPGDAVDFHGDTLWINGKTAKKINLKKWRSTVKQIRFYGGIVPSATFLLLGDNTANSRDSGRLGLISRDQITGKVVGVIREDGERNDF